MSSIIKAVPTNIITGFLGVGKTSTILQLLKNKPGSEKWAVLVNEFGEIGVDGSLFEGQQKQERGVFIREVPGGCMCCTSGLPMQIALNQLLTLSKPDRLLIEPTGLGHPKEVLEILSSDFYREVLSLQKILTLVDARKLKDERYKNHSTFQQQIQIADVIIGNKIDLYQDDDKTALEAYVKVTTQNSVKVLYCQHGIISFDTLIGDTQNHLVPHTSEHHHTESHELPINEQPIPESGFIQASNQGEGFQSTGWRFSADKVFSQKKVFTFLSGLNVERMKAVFITDEGVFGYNLADDALTQVELDDAMETRIEILSQHTNSSWEASLIDCLTDF
ncbi:MAG: GTP-binding protein [Pseudomonadota bacterium]